MPLDQVNDCRLNMMKFIAKKILIAYTNISKKCRISMSANINHKTRCEGRNTLHKGSILNSSLIGFASFVGQNSKLINCKIGRFCSIGHSVEVISYTHPSSIFASTHPAFYSTLKQAGFSFVSSNKFNEYLSLKHDNQFTIEIGNDVWIGANVLIMGGINIGDGAIIGAGALVTKDVPPYSIVGGTPAKIIKMRFDSDHIKFLLELKWWNKSLSWIKDNSASFENINYLISTTKNKL